MLKIGYAFVNLSKSVIHPSQLLKPLKPQWVQFKYTIHLKKFHGFLPTSSRGHKCIVVISDLFSKWVETFPFRVIDSETLARVLVDEAVCRYGVSSYLYSDQGSNLNNEVISSL